MIVVLIVILIVCLVGLSMRKPRNFPEGPIWLPVIGSALSIAKSRKETGMLIKGIQKISEQTPGAENVIGFKVGKEKVVFAISTESLIEMASNSDLDGRPKGIFYETRTWNLRRGLIFTDGDFWQIQRRFVQKHLKNFGYARKGMREICENEAEFCINDIKKLIAENGGKSIKVSMTEHFTIYILNTLWLMMAGIRYDSDDKDMNVLKHLLTELLKNVDMMGAPFSHFPILRFIAPKASGYNEFVSSHNEFHKFIRREVENHKKIFKKSDEPRDLIDAYLQVLYSEDENVDESFSELQLLANCLDMFIAGTETTNKSLNFIFLHMVRNPEIQRKAREEIDRVIGHNRFPTLEDRTNMPYCEAVVMEGIRIFMSNTCGIAHRAVKDTTLSGYNIPKDTMVIAMLSGNLLDQKYIKNPFAFDPNNFLDDSGKISIPAQHFPFALGKRRCMGESLARSNLFLFCTTIIQNFFIKIPSGHPTPSDDPVDGATATVQEYGALFVQRF